jgi:hypothetical protein
MCDLLFSAIRFAISESPQPAAKTKTKNKKLVWQIAL